MCTEDCSGIKLLEAYRDQWKRVSLSLMQKTRDLEIERDKYKELAWLGYKVIRDKWEPTQYEQAYEEMVEDGH